MGRAALKSVGENPKPTEAPSGLGKQEPKNPANVSDLLHMLNMQMYI